MKKLAMAVALMCALSTSIFAGNMPTTGIADPPPTLAGEMPTGGKSEQPPPPLAGDMPTGGKSQEPSLTTSGISTTLLVTVILTIVSLR